jgi:uncharacterized protein (TIGR03032 family)
MLEYRPVVPPPPLRSMHTPSFPAILARLGITVGVTTYQANKLVLLRADGEALNTHFRDFRKPMGLAISSKRLAVGIQEEIHEFRNLPAVCPHLEPAGKHDACYMPRTVSITGDIDIHEMAWVGEELWFVNTRFSCLCTLDGVHSFVPRWWPRFITALAPEDRCHLNGLGLAPDAAGRPVPRYATAHSATDSEKGWREHKKDGGVLIDIPSGEVVAGGLAMPHSPRWHNGKVWLLESGTGSIGVVDPSTGRYEPVAHLPGFTRGLDFYGSLAFVGLSQVRESAIFSGIPIAERPAAERASGVWVLDIASGKTIAFLKFEDAVQEIFAVQLLPGLRFPEVIVDECPLRADAFDVPPASLVAFPERLRRGGPAS